MVGQIYKSSTIKIVDGVPVCSKAQFPTGSGKIYSAVKPGFTALCWLLGISKGLKDCGEVMDLLGGSKA